jgi:hypothetical protein
MNHGAAWCTGEQVSWYTAAWVGASKSTLAT